MLNLGEPMSQTEPLTVEEVAAELRVHPETVRNWIRTGELDALDIGREYRIYRADLDAFIQRRKTARRKKQTD
jgi:excisionase family DNA binding protein